MSSSKRGDGLLCDSDSVLIVQALAAATLSVEAAA